MTITDTILSGTPANVAGGVDAVPAGVCAAAGTEFNPTGPQKFQGVRVISLFAGIGGFDLGFSRAGATVVAHVEKDGNCRKLLEAKWPEAVSLPDVLMAGASTLPACDVLCGGWPCQDLSVAGKRAGLAGARSGLFYEYTRIAHELQPAFLVWENVPGLLNSDQGRDMLRVVAEFQRIGYGGGWRTLDAQYLGVAQRRRRVFGVFARRDLGAARCAEVLSLHEGMRGHPAPGRKAGEGTAGTPAARLNSGGNSGGFRSEPGSHLVEQESLNRESLQRGSVNGTLSSKWAKGSGGPSRDECYNLVAFDERVITSPVNRSSVEPGMPAPALNGGGQCTIAFPERMSGTQCARTEDLALVLQSLNPTAVATFQQSSLKQRGTFGYDADARVSKPCKTGADGQMLQIGSTVRRLTPRECERLQGFPDDWTAGFSDSTRYRMLGNAVAVPVAEWLARRLLTVFQPTTQA